jgi:peptide/nickel transport system ATP-binding protein
VNEVVLDIQNLETSFATKKGIVRAVDGVDLQVRRGETLGLVGESGCGKTVLGLSIMGLIDSPGKITGGKILFKGEDLVTKSREEIRQLRGDRISMIFQDPTVTLNPVLRISEQLEEVFRYHRGMGGKEARQKSLELLSLVGIPQPEERIDRYPFEFSGGMQQRVVIAIAVALNPELLLADEPTTALDVTVQAQIIKVLKDLKQQKDSAIILITHDMGVVAELCETVAVTYAGNIIELADLETILERPSHPYTIGLIESIPKMEEHGKTRLRAIPGTLSDPTDLPPGCKFHPRCLRAEEECKQTRPVLRELSPGHKVACHLD